MIHPRKYAFVRVTLEGVLIHRPVRAYGFNRLLTYQTVSVPTGTCTNVDTALDVVLAVGGVRDQLVTRTQVRHQHPSVNLAGAKLRVQRGRYPRPQRSSNHVGREGAVAPIV